MMKRAMVNSRFIIFAIIIGVITIAGIWVSEKLGNTSIGWVFFFVMAFIFYRLGVLRL